MSFLLFITVNSYIEKGINKYITISMLLAKVKSSIYFKFKNNSIQTIALTLHLPLPVQ